MASLPTRIQGPVAVIGDVHGQADKLDALLQKLDDLPDIDQRWIVFIGDFVDRGPEPGACIEMFFEVCRRHPKTTAIAGNHEFAMCSALGWLPNADYANWPEQWTQYYDSESTFASYGVEHGDLAGLAAAIPEHHKQFLLDLPWCIEHPQFFFVHAGMDPNTPFMLQLRILRERDLSLNRPIWLYTKAQSEQDLPADCPVPVVSGHVRVPRVVMTPRRILCDTTGGIEGDLSCVLLPEARVITSAASGTTAPPVGGGSVSQFAHRMDFEHEHVGPGHLRGMGANERPRMMNGPRVPSGAAAMAALPERSRSWWQMLFG